MDIFTTAQAAEKLGLTTGRIRQACRTLGVKKLGRDFLITPDDLAAIQGRIGKEGHPLKLDGRGEERDET